MRHLIRGGVCASVLLGVVAADVARPRTAQEPDLRASAAPFVLPEPATSFGAVVNDGWLYVYGGHRGSRHGYSTDGTSGRFHRRRLAAFSAEWEELPGGPPLQGPGLVVHGGVIYRIGGMQPRNAPGERQSLHSVADVARFDPALGRWSPAPSLTTPRSSHDAVVVGDRLVVAGGWTMSAGESSLWATQVEVLDLSQPDAVWVPLPQPFERRALTMAALGGSAYVIGGISKTDEVTHEVAVLNPVTGTWSAAPALPGGRMSGFGPAAAVAAGRLFVSIDDGAVYELSAPAWRRIGHGTPRIVHRMVADDGRLIIAGGSAGGRATTMVETLPVPSAGAVPRPGVSGAGRDAVR